MLNNIIPLQKIQQLKGNEKSIMYGSAIQHVTILQ